jgi:type I restriction enzyme S subunit
VIGKTVDPPKLPNGWVYTKVGEIAEVIRGASPRPKGDPRYFGGNIPWIMISDISKEEGKFISKTRDKVTEEGAKRSRYLKTGTLILSNSATVCVPKILAADGCIHDGFVAFPNLSKKLEILYLYYYFQHIRQKIINENRQGVTQVNLNTGIVREIPVPLPPFLEQRRIVGKVDELFSFLDSGTESLHKVQAQLKRYRQVVLKYAFEGKLTEEWRKTHKNQAMPNRNLLEDNNSDESRIVSSPVIQKLPEEWFWIKLSKISASMKNGIYRPSSFYAEEGFACLRMYNIEKGFIIWKDIKRMKLKRQEIEEYELIPGDILVNRVNSRELVGKSAVIPGGLEPCVYESKNIRLRLINQIADSKYVAFWILYYGQKYFNRNAQQTVGMASINQEQLGSMLIPFCSLLEQQLIVQEVERHFSVADAAENAIFSGLKLAERLRQSILKKAFEGGLVSQDPSDEPAETLLRQIREQKSHVNKNNAIGLINYVK